MGGAPGLSGVQSRNAAGISSFAQTIGGGSQAHTPLDPSYVLRKRPVFLSKMRRRTQLTKRSRGFREFPSLSGAPQTQQQNSQAQAIWSNPNIRTAQHTPVQRAQGQGATPQPPSAQANRPQQEHQPQPQDEPSSAHSQYGGAMDDYRFGGQSGVGQLSGAPQQQQQVNIEEFPPLGGGGGGDIGQDRRTGMIQNAAYGGNAGAFGSNVHQGRNGMSSPVESPQDSFSERLGGTVLRDDRAVVRINQFMA